MANAALSDDEGCLWAEVLKSNSVIRTLNLESNSIGTAAIVAISEALRANTSLTEVRTLARTNLLQMCEP